MPTQVVRGLLAVTVAHPLFGGCIVHSLLRLHSCYEVVTVIRSCLVTQEVWSGFEEYMVRLCVPPQKALVGVV